MKIIVKYDDGPFPPILKLVIHDAPHRRMHIEVIRQYRDALRMACMRAGVLFPIDHAIDLDVTFVNPTSPDNGNIYIALEQAMDGKTLNGPGIVTDDSLISNTYIRKLFLNQREPAQQPLNLPRFTIIKAAS